MDSHRRGVDSAKDKPKNKTQPSRGPRLALNQE